MDSNENVERVSSLIDFLDRLVERKTSEFIDSLKNGDLFLALIRLVELRVLESVSTTVWNFLMENGKC